MILTLSNLYPYPGRPGRGVFNLQLFRALAARTPVQNRVLVATRPPVPLDRAARLECPDPLPPTRYIGYRHLPLIGRDISHRFVARALRRHRHQDPARPDAVLASWLYPDGIAAARVYGADGIPVWIMALGSDRFHLHASRRRRAILKTLPWVSGWIAVSSDLADALADGGIPADRIRVIPNGVDTERFHPGPADGARAILSSRIGPGLFPAGELWIWIGNLVPVKAPEIAIRALSIRVRQNGDRAPARLVMIGDGPLRRRMHTLAAGLGIREHVLLAGQRPHDEIPLWLQAADGLVLSSRSEGMPNAIAEALACGCPVAATDTGACREMLDGQPACRVAPPGDPAALADAMAGLFRDLRRDPRRPSFKRTWHEMAGEVLACLERNNAS